MSTWTYELGLQLGTAKSASIGGVATPHTVESQQSVMGNHEPQQQTSKPQAPAGEGMQSLLTKRVKSKRVGTTLAPMFGMDGKSEANKDTLKEKDQD